MYTIISTKVLQEVFSSRSEEGSNCILVGKIFPVLCRLSSLPTVSSAANFPDLLWAGMTIPSPRLRAAVTCHHTAKRSHFGNDVSQFEFLDLFFDLRCWLASRWALCQVTLSIISSNIETLGRFIDGLLNRCLIDVSIRLPELA